MTSSSEVVSSAVSPAAAPEQGEHGLRLRDVLSRNVELYGGSPAVACDDVVWSWRDLAGRANRIASRLRDAGVERGDRVLVLQRNGPEIVELYFAIALLGAIIVPVSHYLSADEVRYAARDSGAKLAFVADGHPVDLPGVPVVATRCDAYERFVAEGKDEEQPSTERPGDPVFLLYTSGTTGRPKGVLHTHATMIENAWTIQHAQNLSHEDVFLSTTPLTHSAAATRVFSMALSGICHVILERYTPELFVAAVQRHGVTSTILVPTMLTDLIDSDKVDLASLRSMRFIVYGAAPSSMDLVRRAMDRLPCGLVHGYGQTESCPGLTVMTAEEHRAFVADPKLAYRLGSIGRAVPGVAIKLIDATGHVVPPGTPGELLVRSNKSMVGYWRMPEASRDAFRDGWLATGDIARRDEDGYLFLVDRQKDVVISGGLNVYPSEIERVLRADPEVLECAVVGVPDSRWGEVPVAVVVPVPGKDPAARLLETCKQQLAGYKQPKRILLTSALPRNGTGKIVKTVIRQAVEHVDAGAVSVVFDQD